MATTISRREFVRRGSSGAAILVLGGLVPACHRDAGQYETSTASTVAPHAPARGYGDWKDVYLQRLAWDKRVRCTHVVNCWYQRNCSWDVYVRDGVVVREEQAGEYPAVNDEVPDFNPRGCQKGACYSALMYAPDRLRYPLRRVGPRGSGKWKRISWDEAYRETADQLIDAVTLAGPDSVALEPGGSLASATWRLGVQRLVDMLDGIELDTNTELDDGQAGAAVTMGTPVSSRSADDFFHSDLILVWGANPVYTQIPNAHFINEARYNGTRVVTIATDYSASSIHSDLFIGVRPGTDAALALAACQVLLERGSIDADFVRSQTDLVLLVKDDGHYLRESDLVTGGRQEQFYAWDPSLGLPSPAPFDLDWAGVTPALEGNYTVSTNNGPVRVRPVLEILRQRLDADYTPKKAAELCGCSAETIHRFADMVAGARAMAGVAGSSIPKLYNGDIIMRAQLLLFMLGGHVGKPGAGFDTTPFLWTQGMDSVGASQWEGLAAKLKHLPALLGRRLAGDSTERYVYDAFRDYMNDSSVVSSVLYWRRHGGLSRVTDGEHGRRLPRPIDEYVEESYNNNWQKRPPADPPRVLVVAGSNLLRRLRSAQRLLETAWPKIKLVVTCDLRMSTTCLQSDILLPGASSYEKDDVPNWFTLLSPYLHITQAAVEPLGECKPEWNMHAELARWVERRARERGVSSFRDRHGNEQRLDDFGHRFTFNGRFDEHAQSQVAHEIVKQTGFVDGGFEELRHDGFKRITGIGTHPFNLGNATDVTPDQPVVNRGWRRSNPGPWPTLTRRVQFYIDHPLYLELGQELPAHLPVPRPGGDYPLVLSGGHTRWSIHAGWRNLDLLLQLQRGEAAAFVAAPDARSRGIKDGDTVRLFNDLGEFKVKARLSNAVAPGMVILYHAWEDYQFPGGKGYRNVLPSPLNPVELAGGYNHLRPVPASLQPGQSDRETRIEMASA